MENIQEIPGMFENEFYVNTGVTEFIAAVLNAPGELKSIGEIKGSIIINRNLCIRISRMFDINADISSSPIKDKCFYVNIGLLNFIYRVLKVGFEMVQMTYTMSKKDHLLEYSNISLYIQ